MFVAGLVVLAYAVGSIPSGYLLVRAFRGADVRDYGSHSVGAINVCRRGGLALGMTALAGDAAKALAMVELVWAATAHPWALVLSGLAVMVGHAYSAWFYLRERRFSGGKSVASGLGCLLGMVAVGVVPWPAAVVPVGVWLGAILAPRLLAGRWFPISPATLLATVSVPVTLRLTAPNPAYWAFGVGMAALITVRHQDNLRRLLAGTEPNAEEVFRCRSGG